MMFQPGKIPALRRAEDNILAGRYVAAAVNIINGFSWSETSEGHKFWSRIYSTLLIRHEK